MITRIKYPKGRRKRCALQFGRLAMHYYPDRDYRTAVRLFREEIRITGGLQKALTALGYHDHKRMLTPMQVGMIEKYLGESDS